MRGWIVGAAAIALAACSRVPAPLTDAEKAALADSVSQLVTASFADLAREATPEKVLRFHVRGNEMVHVEQGTIYPTYDSIVKVVTAVYRPGTKLNVTLEQRRVAVLDRDVVVFAALLDGVLKDSANHAMPLRAAWTAVWHRTPEGWKMAADHESMAPPAPPAPPKPERRAR